MTKKDALKFVRDKYKRYIENIEWHIRTNAPTGEGLKLCLQRIEDYKGFVKELSQFMPVIPESKPESPKWEDYAQDYSGKNTPSKPIV